jgi:predicted amidophosphoribosyltransferase
MLREQFPGQIRFLHNYTDAIRRDIWNVKIRSQLHVCRTLMQTFSDWIREDPALCRVGFVMPMPSSLWGRIRGRIDLASFLADALVYSCNLRWVDPPLGWHWHKKAQRSRHQRYQNSSSVRRYQAFTDDLLIVDDLTTTGSSFADLTRHLVAPRIFLRCLAGSVVA